MVKLITTDIVGTASATRWSQAQKISYDNDHQIMLVVELSSETDDTLVDLATIGPEILLEIEKNGQTVTNIEQLERLVKEVTAGVKEGLQLQILVGSLTGSELILYGIGTVQAYLARNKQLAKLRESWGDGAGIAGVLKSGDVVVLATDKFTETIGQAEFKKILTQEENPAELLAPLLHKQSETSSVAAIVGEVKQDERVVAWPQIRLQAEPKKRNLWIGAIVFVLLIIMIGVGMVQRVKQVAERDYASLSASVEANLAETLSIGDLNPERARSLLSESRNQVNAYLATKISDTYKQKANNLMSEIDSADSKAFKKNDIQLSTLVELPILVDGLSATKMKSDGKGNLVFVDTQAARLVAMNLVDRSRQVVEVPKGEAMVDASAGDPHVYELGTTGVNELFWKKDQPKKVIESDEFWKEPTYIQTFAGNVYILDKGQGEIWKYPTLGDTFGGRRRWFAVGITPDLSNVVDMKVVGDIWLLTSTGKLARYSRGAPVTFSMDGFPAKGDTKKLSEPSAMWVSDNAVYVLENGAERVVVFGTDGKYQAQYVNSEFSKASDLVIVDDKGYVLVNNTVKEFGL